VDVGVDGEPSLLARNKSPPRRTSEKVVSRDGLEVPEEGVARAGMGICACIVGMDGLKSGCLSFRGKDPETMKNQQIDNQRI
jgi:hypothetical protein